MRVVSRVSGATAILFVLAGCAVPSHTEVAIPKVERNVLHRPDLTAALDCESATLAKTPPLHSGPSVDAALQALGNTDFTTRGRVVFEKWTGTSFFPDDHGTPWYLVFTKKGHLGLGAAYVWQPPDKPSEFDARLGVECITR